MSPDVQGVARLQERNLRERLESLNSGFLARRRRSLRRARSERSMVLSLTALIGARDELGTLAGSCELGPGLKKTA
jgi:hypothetical protein